MSHTRDLYTRAKRRIPGGTQLLSKRPEMFLPERWPAYYRTAKGVDVWDLDGNRYLDMSIAAIGACPLGFADDDVNAAVTAAITAGSMCTLNCAEDVELADLLCELHPWAEMVRFARSGGEAMAIAVRIARAATGRDAIAVCGYHGWHDWYLAANLTTDTSGTANRNGTGQLAGHLLPGLDPAGVPRALADSTHTFTYNDRAAFDAVIAAHGAALGAIVMEPVRYADPAPGFLDHVRATASRLGIVLVFDEITAGWRTNIGGAHLRLGVNPDVAVFAKAISNGFPMAAIIGTEAVMDAAQRTFISSTYWTERIGPTAALATIRKMHARDVPAHLMAIGNRVRAGWKALAERHELPITIAGVPPLSSFALDLGEHSAAAHTLFTQRLLDKNILASKAFYATFAHQPVHVDAYLAAVDEAFATIREVAASGDFPAKLAGPVAHAGFRRLA